MIQRCTNENHISHEDYGARGITICDAWLDDFINFFNDLGERPEGYSLDRIDCDGNYEPSNCRWADDRTQVLNRHLTRWITFNGETLCVSDWATKTRIPRATLSKRLNQYKWSVERSLTEDVDVSRRIKTRQN